MQPDCGQDLDVGAIFDHQSLDYVELVEFGSPIRDVWQIPARRRGQMSHTPMAVKRTPALQNAMNRAGARRPSDSAGHQLSMNRISAKLTQITLGSQIVSQRQHEVFHIAAHAPAGVMWATGSVSPVNAVEPLSCRTSYPSLHREQADTILASHRPLRFAAAHGCYHLAADLFNCAFLSWHHTPSLNNIRFPSIIPDLELLSLT